MLTPMQQKVIDACERGEKSIWLIGGTGCGKSYIANIVREKYPDVQIVEVCTSGKFVISLQSELDNPNLPPEYVARLNKAGATPPDPAHAPAGSQEEKK